MSRTYILLVLLSFAAPAGAADVKAGEQKSGVCAGCHGADGISVSPDIPNLAGQKAEYLTAQLKAFREDKRKNPLMNAIAPQLSDADVDNLVAYFSSLPGAGSGSTKSPMAESINRTRVQFPKDYKQNFTRYMAINFPDRKQVRWYYANRAALDAAGTGKPLPDGSMIFTEVYKAKLDAGKNPVMGADGFFEPGELAFFTAMQTGSGWGDEFPAELRNGNWNYAVFNADSSLKSGTNQAKCLACHKPLDRDSYVFTLSRLAGEARKSN